MISIFQQRFSKRIKCRNTKESLELEYWNDRSKRDRIARTASPKRSLVAFGGNIRKKRKKKMEKGRKTLERRVIGGTGEFLLASFEVNSIGERIGGIDGEIFENWRARGGCHAATDRTMADNRIASDFCMPISRPVLCRRQCANNYAKRRPFIRPFGRIQTAFPYPLSSRGANNRSDARRFQFFSTAASCRWHRSSIDRFKCVSFDAY